MWSPQHRVMYSPHVDIALYSGPLLSDQFGCVQASKLDAFLRSMVPASGWDLTPLLRSPRIHLSQHQCRIKVAALALCSAAAVSGTAPSGRDVPRSWRSLAALAVAPPVDELPGLCVHLLACCVHTVAKTIASQRDGGHSERQHKLTWQGSRPSLLQREPARHQGPQGNELNDLLQPVLHVIDYQLGDVVALLPDATKQRTAYAELAATAAQYAATAAGAADSFVSHAVSKSARRLWAAFVLEGALSLDTTATADSSDLSPASASETDTSTTTNTGSASDRSEAGDHKKACGHKAGGSEADSGAETPADKQTRQPGGSGDDSSESEDTDKSSSEATRLPEGSCNNQEEMLMRKGVDATHGGLNEHPMRSTKSVDTGTATGNAGTGIAGNVRVAEAALKALSSVASSDAAMAVLFDADAVAARFALPQSVLDAPLPLKSVVLLGQLSDGSSSDGADGQESMMPEESDATPCTASAVRTELLLLIEVRPPARRGTLHAGAGAPLCATRVCASQAV